MSGLYDGMPVRVDVRDGMPVRVDVRVGCYCNLFYCVHQFRLWSKLWYHGVRRVMPLKLDHPPILFRCKV